jgi:hypothetical protein
LFRIGTTENPKTGGRIGIQFNGPLTYAEAITMMAPNADAIHRMMEICCNYNAEFFIELFQQKLNRQKCMLFEPSAHKLPSRLNFSRLN